MNYKFLLGDSNELFDRDYAPIDPFNVYDPDNKGTWSRTVQGAAIIIPKKIDEKIDDYKKDIEEAKDELLKDAIKCAEKIVKENIEIRVREVSDPLDDKRYIEVCWKMPFFEKIERSLYGSEWRDYHND